MRPILVELLSHGIRMWIDDPQASGLELNRDLFTGNLVDGEPWQDDVWTALEGAAGMLVIDAPGGVNRPEVAVEIRFASQLVRRHSGRFKIFPVMPKQGEARFLSELGIRNHGPRLNLTQDADGAWSLTELCRLRLAELAKTLRAHAAKWVDHNPISTVAAPTVQAELRDFTLPFRADRRTLRSRMISAYMRYSQATAEPEAPAPLRPALIICGLSEDAPARGATVTVPTYVIPNRGLDFLPAAASRKVIPVNWPATSPSDARGFRQEFGRTIAYEHQGADAKDLSPKASAEKFKADGMTRVVHSTWTVGPEVDARAFRSGIQAWLGFWDEFPHDDSDAEGHITVVPVLDINLGREDPARKWFQRDDRREFARWLSSRRGKIELETGCRRIEPIISPPLEKISFSCVEHWLGEDPQMRELDEGVRASLRKKLLALVAKDPLRMDAWADAARPHLSEAGFSDRSPS